MKLGKRIALAAAALVVAAGPSLAGQIEKTDVKLSVGGKPLLYYLPLTLTERLGFFKDEGLNVEINDFAGGSKSLQALMGGSVDVTTGSYEHTIQLQAKGKEIVAIVQLGQFPGIVLGVRKDKAAQVKSVKDLKGLKVGVTAPGSSTNYMVNYLLTKNGLQPTDVSFIGVGGGSSAVAAMKRGEIDAISNLDPVISQLENSGDIVVLADSRTAEGNKSIYGGAYPAAVLYTTPEFVEKYPNTAQALVNAFVRTLKWLQTATPEQIAAVLPEEYFLGDKGLYMSALKRTLPTYSPTGRFDEEGPKNVLTVLSKFNETTAAAKIDLSKTYTNRFVDAAKPKGQ